MEDKRYTPNLENKTLETPILEKYFYCDEGGVPIFLTKEIYKNEKKVVFYPYSVNPADGSVKSKRIKKIELLGWAKIEDIPNDFKTNGKYGLKTLRAKSFFSALYNKYKDVYSFTIGINIANKFKHDHISLNWSDLKTILGEIYKEKSSYDKEKSFLILRNLSKINNAVVRPPRFINGGDLQRFLQRYSSFDKINSGDLNALSGVLDLIPPSVIKTTANFINSKEQINKVYIEDIIAKFEKLLSSPKDNEKQWQDFFENHSWVLSHLFPYEVILREKEAYVGGKTIGNDDGRITDFLFENGFKDNYALLETKTHKKELLKKTVYRKPATFVMSDDLSGGIGQCLDQKHTFLKEFGKQNESFDAKCILVIGLKSRLNTPQKQCFELLRSSNKHVEIVTFDEVLMKLKGLVKVLNFNTN